MNKNRISFIFQQIMSCSVLMVPWFWPPALPELGELTMECVLVELERVCEEKMQQAIETEEGLGIEYDEDVVCDVCRSPEGEDGNEMVFCDKCNVCVHQVRLHRNLLKFG